MDLAARYTPLDLLGAGAHGLVFAAVDQRTGARVAIKALRDGEPATAEADLLLALRHPALLRVLDRGHGTFPAHGLHEPTPCFVLELAPGGPLTPWCGRLEWPAARAVLARLLDGLATLHSRGVVHRVPEASAPC